ncbi:hypothetical protein OE88DRAFT_1810956 [Heliocybe sulcata]|uniref:Golgi apparatus membrane protein TVP38 n=1 Tax=Heliocybe sulcata TaxID=5364 RepID=A0A5C3MRE1_9AGAM|nr:hypothetical protein OE88DRAFT_1810956 [Heliocybe sulcata]
MAAPYPAYQQQSYPYPPQQSVSPNNNYNNNDRPFDGFKANAGRDLARTPSPTPSEAEELSKQGAFDWQKLRNWRFWIRREWLWYYVGLVLITAFVGAITIYHTQIVHWLKPAADWMHDLRFGFLIPIAIFFVISFPPLFGHEIVAVICGLVWGLWIGFAIVAAGTFVGEVGNFYAFKYCCRARGEKLEKTQISYACLAKVVRDGGFKIALIARLKIGGAAFPVYAGGYALWKRDFDFDSFANQDKRLDRFLSLQRFLADARQTDLSHLCQPLIFALFFSPTLIIMSVTTAVFSTCGMGIITFSIAAILSLPKQFVTVYLGVILEQSSDGGTVDTKTRIIDYSVIAITTLMTFAAMWYIYSKMGKVKPGVIYDRRKARQAKLQREAQLGPSPYGNPSFASTTNVPFNVAGQDLEHQQWDKEGRAIGYSPGPIAAPQPYRPDGFNDRQGDIGNVYPMSEVGRGRDGRLPVRTQSEESVTWDTSSGGHEREYEMPRVQSPPGLHEPISANDGRGQREPQTPRQQQYAPHSGQYAPPSGPPLDPVVPALPPPPQSPRSASGNTGFNPYGQGQTNLSPSPMFHGVAGPHPAARVASPAILPSQSPAPGQFASYPNQQFTSYPSRPYPNPYGASPTQTPTQASFSTQQQYAPAQPQSPQLHQMQSFHAPEPSDASFYTAHPGPHSRNGTLESSGSPLQPPNRVLSPPPPSYHTMQ